MIRALNPAAIPNGYGRFKHFPRSILTPDFVLACIEQRGVEFFWRPRGDDYFRSPKGRSVWNGRIAGKPISTRTDTKGYQFFTLCGYEIQVHRLVWLFATGAWPVMEIDHLNGIRDDNRLENLREVTRAINTRNRAMRSDNSSGITGVRKQGTRWRAFFTINGKTEFLGSFATKEDAGAARQSRLLASGDFTSRHGQPANDSGG